MSYVSEHNNAATRLLVRLRNAWDMTESSCQKLHEEDLSSLPPEVVHRIRAKVNKAQKDLASAIDLLTTAAKDQLE